MQLRADTVNILQLDMNLLKVLYVMLTTGSTSRTAQKLALSPSAVSHALARLREALGDPLFRREGNAQVPTPFALGIKERLIPLFVSLNEELFGEEHAEERRFRLVLPPALNVLLTPELASKGHQAGAIIECLTFERRAWRDELLEGKIDLLLAVGDHQKRVSALHYDRIGRTRLIAVFGQPLYARLSGREALAFDELAQFEHFYCHPWPQDVNELDRQQARAGLGRRLAFTCSDYGQLAPALRHAPLMAIVPAPWFATLNDKAQLFTLPLSGDQAVGSLFLQYRTSTVEWKLRLIASLRRTLTAWYR